MDDFTREVFRDALSGLMSDLSEDNWAAGWMMGTEFDLWAIINGDKPPCFNGWTVAEAEKTKLRMLSRRLDEWVVWSDGAKPVPLDEWRKTYAARMAAT